MDFKHTNLPIENNLPKLVRDNILQAIRDNEKIEPKFHIAESDSEYDFYIKKKLIEEAVEVSKSENREEIIKEIADVLEILEALKMVQNISDKELFNVKMIKKEKNGGFSKRHIFEGKP